MSQAFLRVVDVVVADRGMGGHAVVPKCHGAVVPFDTDLDVRSNGDVLERYVSVDWLETDPFTQQFSRTYVEQQLENGIGFLVFQAYDAPSEAWVHIQRFLARYLE